MKYLVVLLVLSISVFAQEQKPCSTEAECNAAFAKKAEAQIAEDKAVKDAAAKAAKDKAEAADKLDNKNPQPIKSESDRLRLEKLQARALLDQQKLQTMEAMIKASMQQPIAQAQASAKAYNDALAELQKSHHAEGCIPVLDEKGDIKSSKDGKEVWDCSKAGK